MNPSRLSALVVSCLLFGATMWGIIWYPYRLLQQRGVSGEISTLFSYAVPLLIFAWFHLKDLKAARRSWGLLLGIGLAAGWTNMSYVLSVLQGEILRVLLLFYLAPLWTVLFARLWLAERLNRWGYGVMAMSISGAMIMLWPPHGGFPLPANKAEWLALTAGMSFALANVLTRKAGTVTLGAKAVAVWAGVTLVSLLALTLEPGQWAFVASATPVTWGALLGVGLLIAAMTYAVQYGLSHAPANQAIIIFLFELVVAAVSSYFLADEALSLQEWIGAALIIAGSLFSGHIEDR
ncbi:MAG TPA: DMT family transporter [Thiobacillaceae bacterium]|nr:DMT family transporter [Thiobacillaceae bacterium]